MLTSILLQINLGSDSLANNIQQTVASAPKAMSFWEMILKGGPVMIPIGILSIAALYIFTERYLTIKKASQLDSNFMNSIKDFIYNGNLDAAKALCRNTDTPIAKMIEKGLKRLGKPINEIEKSIEDVGKLELGKVEKNVSILGTIAGIAPLFGFLGTIFGVIKIFYNIALADNISIGLIAGGLYEKMITSAAGLVIGILAFAFHHILVHMIDKLIQKMEQNSIEFIDLIQDSAE